MSLDNAIGIEGQISSNGLVIFYSPKIDFDFMQSYISGQIANIEVPLNYDSLCL